MVGDYRRDALSMLSDPMAETEIVKGFDASTSGNSVSNYAAASSVDGRLIQTSKPDEAVNLF
jgi:hypothetical protein